MKRKLIRGFLCVLALIFCGLVAVANVSEARDIMSVDMDHEENDIGNGDLDGVSVGWQEIEGGTYYFHRKLERWLRAGRRLKEEHIIFHWKLERWSWVGRKLKENHIIFHWKLGKG